MDTIVSVTAAAKLGVIKPAIMCWLSSGGVVGADDDDEVEGPAVDAGPSTTPEWVVSQLEDVCCGRVVPFGVGSSELRESWLLVGSGLGM